MSAVVPTRRLILASGQTLEGVGEINGNLVVSGGATIAPGGTNTTIGITTGANPTGTLTANNTITLNGSTLMKLNGSGVSDEIVSSTKITYGGTLNLANISGSPLAAGNSFQIFSAPSLTGSFSSISPATPGPIRIVDSFALGRQCALAVVSVGASIIENVQVASGNILFSGSGGTPSANFVVYTQTNLANTNWIPVMTNAFDIYGGFNVTNAFNIATPQLFYRIK